MGCAAYTNGEPTAHLATNKVSIKSPHHCTISNLLTMTFKLSQCPSNNQQLSRFTQNNQTSSIDTCNTSPDEPQSQRNEFSPLEKKLLKTRKMSFDTIYEVSQQYWCSDADRNSGKGKKEDDLHDRQTGCLCNQQQGNVWQMQEEQVMPMFSLLLPTASIQPHFQPTN